MVIRAQLVYLQQLANEAKQKLPKGVLHGKLLCCQRSGVPGLVTRNHSMSFLSWEPFICVETSAISILIFFSLLCYYTYHYYKATMHYWVNFKATRRNRGAKALHRRITHSVVRYNENEGVEIESKGQSHPH